jgi:DNA-binding transcriptional MocR family regulator
VNQELKASGMLLPTAAYAGGPYVFCRILPPVTMRRLREEAHRYGVGISSGDAFFAQPAEGEYIRLSVMGHDGDALRNGVRRLIHAANEATGLA